MESCTGQTHPSTRDPQQLVLQTLAQDMCSMQETSHVPGQASLLLRGIPAIPLSR